MTIVPISIFLKPSDAMQSLIPSLSQPHLTRVSARVDVVWRRQLTAVVRDLAMVISR